MSQNKERWFLHVSDLHIPDTEEDAGFLRKGYYKEFLDNLSTKILGSISEDRLSGMIFSGDLVDKGAVKKLQHGRLVLEYLSQQLGLQAEQLVAIHGNHDFVREVATRRSYVKAIAEAKKILSEFSKPIDGCISPLGNLHCLESGIYVLTLDSMQGQPLINVGDPATPPTSAVDEIVEMVRSNVQNEDILIVVSHHSPSDFDVIGDAENRIWRSGKPIAQRLSDLRAKSKGPMVWISSDLHIPVKPYSLFSFTCIPGAHLDGRPVLSIQKPSVVLFSLEAGTHVGKSQIVELIQPAHSRQASGGSWRIHEADEFSRSPKVIPEDKTYKKIAKSNNSVHLGSNALPPIERFEDGSSVVTGRTITLERQVLEIVAKERLYHLGRFETSPDQVSLGWVSIGPLMMGLSHQPGNFSSSSPLFPQVILQMRDWLIAKCESEKVKGNPESVVILGIDCWGAVMSSQISVMTGWRNFCIAGRGRGVHHTTFERITPRVVREVSNASLVIFLTDVIASGDTIVHVREELLEKVKVFSETGKFKRGLKWVAACI